MSCQLRLQNTKLPHPCVETPVVSRVPLRITEDQEGHRGSRGSWPSSQGILRTDPRPLRLTKRTRDWASSLMPRPTYSQQQNTARFAVRELLDTFTMGPSLASAAGHFSDGACRTTPQPSISAGGEATATLTARPGATVSTADI